MGFPCYFRLTSEIWPRKKRYHSAWSQKLPTLRLLTPNISLSFFKIDYPKIYTLVIVSMSKKPSKEDEELSKIDALIAQHADVFDGVPQLRYSRAVKYGTDQSTASKGPAVPHGGYRCHRCGEAGHFIQDCPVGEDGKGGSKVRQARGIPKAFLETISEAEAAKAGGAFMSAEGGLVVMKSATKEERLRLVGPSIDVELQRSFGKPWEEIRKAISCFLCSQPVKYPMATTCCGELFCKECILRHLDRTVIAVDDDALECPNCDRKNLSSADLVPNKCINSIVAPLSASDQSELKSLSTIRLSRPVATSGAKKLKASREEFDIDIGDLLAKSDEQKTHAQVTKRHPNTVLVPGGPRNPFFEVGARLLTENEFEKWQAAYRSTLARVGQLRV